MQKNIIKNYYKLNSLQPAVDKLKTLKSILYLLIMIGIVIIIYLRLKS